MSTQFITRTALSHYLATFLHIERFHDYCPNGLQVEGRDQIRRIVTGVSANQALLNAAIEKNADAVLVHHGYFWKNENPAITHIKKQRLKLLLLHDINLFAYHLPLDAHLEVGNNVVLGQLLGLEAIESFGEQGLLFKGLLKKPQSLRSFGARIAAQLQREPLIIGDLDRVVEKVTWCTGGAQQYFHTVAMNETDVYLTGEASEFVTHLAFESQVAFIAAGHHATERYGIQALGAHLQAEFDLEHIHINVDNSV